MSNQYKPTNIAHYFILKSRKEDRPITHLKLQKLLYYAQAWSLAIRKQKIFNSDIEAWMHGPVVRSIYNFYKKYGFGNIVEIIDESSITIDAETQKFLDEVYLVYGKYDGKILEKLTHSEKPWQKARDNAEIGMSTGNIITPESMTEYYSELITRK